MTTGEQRRKFHLRTYGCQMNKLDSEIVCGIMLREGYEQTADEKNADVIIVNTCSVRQHAEDRVYSYLGSLRRVKDKNPGLVVVLMGCMAQKEQAEIFKRAPTVDVVCGTKMFTRLPELVERARQSRKTVCAAETDAPVTYHRLTGARPGKFQAYVAVMRGCDNFCSYCIVPYVRGRETSRPRTDIVEEVKRLAEDGCKEVTLLGQNVNSYGKGLQPPARLSDLLADIDAIPGIERIRFVTSHPKDFSTDIIEAIRDLPHVCEHVHLPAQSGSDRILKAMNRGYTASHYLDLLAEAWNKVPGITFASDFIVGFPGETEDDFQATADLMRKARFLNSFIFKYSPRPGTAAARLEDDVPVEVKKARNQELLSVQEEISRELNDAMIGEDVEVLVEGPSKSDKTRLTGRTRRNQIVVFEGNADLAGALVRVRVESATPLCLYGVLQDDPGREKKRPPLPDTQTATETRWRHGGSRLTPKSPKRRICPGGQHPICGVPK